RNYRVRKVDATTGVITTVAGTGASGHAGDGGPATSALLSNVHGVAVDSAGRLFLSDDVYIRRVDTAGVITGIAGNGNGFAGDGGPATAALFSSPRGVAVDSPGNVYIADAQNSRVRRIAEPSGIVTTVAGSGAPGFFGDGA